MTNSPTAAIAVAANQSAHGPRIDKWLGETTYTGWCLKSVRTCYDVDAFDFTKNNGRGPLAHEAFDYAKFKHPTTDPADIPRGVPVYWKGGSTGAGHIAISTGNGYCWSTDIKRPGYFDHVPIATIRAKWGMTMLGWTEDLNGVRVWTKPTTAKEEPVASLNYFSLFRQRRNSENVLDLDLIDGLIEHSKNPRLVTAAKVFRYAVNKAANTFIRVGS